MNKEMCEKLNPDNRRADLADRPLQREQIDSLSSNSLVRDIRGNYQMPAAFGTINLFDSGVTQQPGDRGGSAGRLDGNYRGGTAGSDDLKTIPVTGDGKGGGSVSNPRHDDIKAFPTSGDKTVESNVKQVADSAVSHTLVSSNFNTLEGFRPSGNDTVQLIKGDAAHPNVAKMVLDRNSDKVPYRTELSVNSSGDQLKVGHEYSIKFTNKLVDWRADQAADAIFQLHAKPAEGKPWQSVQGGKLVGLGGPEVMLTTANGEYHFFAGKKQIWHGKIEEGKWNNWEIKMRVDSSDATAKDGKDGYLDLYRNGVLLASAKGANIADVDRRSGEPLAPEVYAKIGIYKWPWKDGRPQTDSSRREIHYSNFSITELNAP